MTLKRTRGLGNFGEWLSRLTRTCVQFLTSILDFSTSSSVLPILEAFIRYTSEGTSLPVYWLRIPLILLLLADDTSYISGSSIMVTTDHTSSARPQVTNRQATAPSVMTVNGHFANVGDAPTMEKYERGIQVIDEDQAFKLVAPLRNQKLTF